MVGFGLMGGAIAFHSTPDQHAKRDNMATPARPVPHYSPHDSSPFYLKLTTTRDHMTPA